MRSYRTVARERGVTTIPIDLREAAAVTTETALTWVELEPQLWLVVTALLGGETPFPKLMRRLMADEGPKESEREARRRRRYRPLVAPALTEEQMIARGAPAPSSPRRRRGRV